MSGRRSRSKGARGELELVHELRRYGIEAERTAQRSGRTGVADVVVGIDPALHVEVKRCEKLSIYAAMDQAVRDSEATGAVPIVAHRRNGREWLIVMRLPDWIDLGRSSWNERGGLGS